MKPITYNVEKTVLNMDTIFHPNFLNLLQTFMCFVSTQSSK